VISAVIARLALVLGSITLVVAMGELGLRLSASPEDTSVPRFDVYRANSSLAYELRPSWSARHSNGAGDFSVVVHTNSLGMRGESIGFERVPESYRVLVLGDSFTFGFGVEDDQTFPSRLAAELGGSAAGIQVMNAGVPGWGTDQYLIRTRSLPRELTPDLLLIVICENDSEDLSWHRLELDANRLPLRVFSSRRMIDQNGRMHYVNDMDIALPDLSIPGTAWLLDHSRFYDWIYYRIGRAWIRTAMWAGARARNTDQGDGPDAPIEELEPEQIQEGLATSAGFRLRYHRFLLENIDRIAAARGIAVRHVNYASRDLAPKPGSPPARLREFCDQDPRCFNTAQLLTAESLASLYLASDGHPNAAGHAAVAEAVASWLRADRELSLPSANPSGNPLRRPVGPPAVDVAAPPRSAP